MQRRCKSCGDWHDLDEPWPEKCFTHFQTKNSAPYVISDNMEPIKHHATGNMISSKRAFAKETRAAGCIEIGNEPIRPRKPILLDKGQRREAIKRSIYELRNGRA
jgi:hypothetical protein